jgi:hypothetical protein
MRCCHCLLCPLLSTPRPCCTHCPPLSAMSASRQRCLRCCPSSVVRCLHQGVNVCSCIVAVCIVGVIARHLRCGGVVCIAALTSVAALLSTASSASLPAVCVTAALQRLSAGLWRCWLQCHCLHCCCLHHCLLLPVNLWGGEDGVMSQQHGR